MLIKRLLSANLSLNVWWIRLNAFFMNFSWVYCNFTFFTLQVFMTFYCFIILFVKSIFTFLESLYSHFIKFFVDFLSIFCSLLVLPELLRKHLRKLCEFNLFVRPFEDRFVDGWKLLKFCTEWLLNGSLADCWVAPHIISAFI